MPADPHPSPAEPDRSVTPEQEPGMSRTVTPLSDFVVAPSDLGAPVGSVAESAWIPAVVPGGVHESLLAAGRIEHPYRDANEKDIRWIEERDWWFRGTFAAPMDLEVGERLRLVFHGLDTVVDIRLNGESLGSHQNMFRPAEYDVTDLVRDENELLLRFSPPLAGLELPPSVADMFGRLGQVFAQLAGEQPEQPEQPDGTAAPDDAAEAEGLGSPTLGLATLRRKATFSWGWDFGPRVPSIGIWRPVELVREQHARIEGHHLRTDRIDPDGTAHVTLRIEVDAFASDAPLVVAASLTSPDRRRYAFALPVVDGLAVQEFELPEAELWWTHDLGAPSLHDLALELREGDAVLDRIDDRIGIRTIALDRPDDPEGGRLFRFVLNGVPIFARGAAWLPASMLVGSVTPQRHRDLVRLARDGGMNMLRIWGGGIYEQDSFYAACDEDGVLIWHDFMFACVDYPSDDADLAAEVAAEARYQVTRLRNRASMALWSGNNEVQLIHGFAYQNYEPGNWGYSFFHELLPATVAELDGGTPYWPGSPWGDAPEEGFMAVNGVRDGDRHAWEVWHGFDFGAGGGDYASVGESRHYRRYAQDRGKFISEFGIHASPELSTLERWIAPDLLAVHSPTFDAHNKDNPKNKGDALLEIITGLPESMEEYVDFTMVSQAEGLKFGIEHYRRRQPANNGTLIWQFNDVWPGFSWSVIDHDTVPKAGYWFARRAFSPILASFRMEGDELQLWISNSGGGEATVVADVELLDVAARPDGGERVEATVPAGASLVAWRATGPFAASQVAWVSSPDGTFPANRTFFAEVKDVPLTDPGLQVEIEPAGDGAAVVAITASSYAYLVHIPSPMPGVRFSDNYLDLRAGDTARIQVSGLPAGFDLQQLAVHPYAGTPA
jgi:beta-mannosidase